MNQILSTASLNCLLQAYWEYVFEDTIDCIAKLPQIAALIYRHKYHNGQVIAHDPELVILISPCIFHDTKPASVGLGKELCSYAWIPE